MSARWLVVIVALAGCLRDQLVPCGDILCPAGRACDQALLQCYVPGEPRCGDGIISPEREETCDDGAANTGEPDACRGNCQLPRCGDGIVDPASGEVCDDGNGIAGDGCRPDCRSSERCGNGEIDIALGEQCDDGNTRSMDGCDPTCAREAYAWRRPLTIPANATSLASPDGPVATYDAGRGVIVLWSAGLTFERRAHAWILVAISTTPANGAAAVYDPERRATLLLAPGQTWAWDGVRWERLFGVNTPSTSGMVATYDGARRRVMAYAGTSLFELAPGGAWTRADGIGLLRNEQSLVYDPITARTLHIAGRVTDDGTTTTSAETWAWDGSTWTPGPALPQAVFGAMGYWDTRTSRVGLAGGWTPTGLSSSWYQLAASWMASGAYGPSAQGAVAHDPLSGWTYTFGGVEDEMSPTATSTTRVFDGTTWQVVLDPGPGSRNAGLVDDSVRGCLVLFGGTDATVWEWCDDRWRSIASSGPSSRTAPTMAFDARRARTVVFGGNASGALADTWEWDGQTWHPGPVSGPPARSFGGMVYDRAREEVLLFGGTGTSALGDTWSYDGVAWVQRTSAQSPSARVRPAMAYDEVRGKVVLFGGLSANASYLDDTWEWDGTSWTRMLPQDVPPATAGAMTFDRDRGRVLYRTMDGDVWMWDGTRWESLESRNVGPTVDGRFQYHSAARESVLFSGGQIYMFTAHGADTENCRTDLDVDGDGLAGCADDDCWARCTPECPPTLAGCSPVASCGDGTCSGLESCGACPSDCGACPAVCGDLRCASAESVASCPGDCPP